MALRDKLMEELDKYISDTFNYIKTMRDFISRSSEWKESREAESKNLSSIKERVQKRKKLFKQKKATKELQKELEDSLTETLKGLREMQVFLDAVEKLVVTSRHVFDQNRVLQPPEGADLMSLLEIILVAQVLSSLLLSFKRDNEAFFKPKMENIEVMQLQLSMYITNIKQICDGFRKGSLDDLCLDNFTIHLNEDVPHSAIEKMFSNITKLNKYRMDEDSRLLFLFQDEHKTFMEEFRERKDKMLDFLGDVEACAVQLDDMSKGAKISSVVGSSVGLVGGILSIVGFALVPVTAGVSLGLVGAGAGLAALSGANSIVTTVTEAKINHTQKKKANETFENFMEHVNVLQNALNEIIKQHFINIQEKFNLKDVTLSGKSVSVARSIDIVVNSWATACKASNLSSDLPRLTQAAIKGPLALTRGARGGFIALNALFIGMDMFVIAKNGKDLSKDIETKISKYLRARAALWKSEIISWQKMNESLETALKDSGKIESILREPFY